MKLKDEKILTAIGLMSGTSMDGIDVAFIRSDGEALVERGAAREFAYEPAFRARLEAALELAATIKQRDERPGDLADLEREITLRHAAAVREFKECEGIGQADLIGFHGQTVLHRPEKGLTVQLGDGPLLARETGIATVFDMRANDMVHGGQGAPLAPAYHAALAADLGQPWRGERPVAFVNIGGIANLTWIGRDNTLIAFDTGPGNALIDQWMQTKAGLPFDEGGAVAAQGRIVQSVLDRHLAQPFFEESIPKSLDRNDFSQLETDAVSLADGARSLARLTAQLILKACDHLPRPPGLWIICGGGRRNPLIMADLKELAAGLNGAGVITAEEAGFDGGSMEAEAWAYLAIRSAKNLPLTWPMTTGCREPVSGGLKVKR